MLRQDEFLSVSCIRKQYSIFFKRVMVLYNLVFFREEKDHKVEDVKQFAIELYEAGHISDYIKEMIDESIANFALLLPGQLKKRGANLNYLDKSISLAISDINVEINGLIHY